MAHCGKGECPMSWPVGMADAERSNEIKFVSEKELYKLHRR